MNTGVLIELSRRFFSKHTAPTPEQVAAIVEADEGLPASVARAIELSRTTERHSDADQPVRVLIHCAGRMWMDGARDAATEVQAAFPTLTPAQASEGARLLRRVIRSRRSNHRNRDPWIVANCKPWSY